MYYVLATQYVYVCDYSIKLIALSMALPYSRIYMKIYGAIASEITSLSITI